MPTLPRITEVVVYSLLSFLPYIIIAIYPFRNHLRYSKIVTTIQIILLSFVQIGLGIWATFFAGNYKGIISIISTLIYGAFYFWTVKTSLGKTLFTLLMLSNISNFIIVSSKCLEGIIFPELARQSYRWSFSAVIIVMQILLLFPLFIYIKRVYTPAVEKEVSRFMWSYLWLIPATFYLLWYQSIYHSSISSLEMALLPSNVIFLFFINLGALLIYYVVALLINEHTKKLELQENNYQLNMEAIQYENLQERIMETRRAKHDIRHHILAMTKYVENKDLSKLKEYLYSYINSMPDDNNIVFCNHYALNMPITYYALFSKNNDIDFDVRVDVPSEISIPDKDLTVLIGNLLENAVEACMLQKSVNRRIIMRGRVENNSLFFTIDNSYEKEPKKDKTGVYISSKRCDTGIGIESVKAIVKRYNGVFNIEHKDKMFYASVMLNL